MTGFPPVLENRGDQSVGACTDIGGTDHEIMSVPILQLYRFVGADSLILMMPFLLQLANGSFNDLREISIDEPGVLSHEFDLTTERKVIADENLGTCDNSGREGLVVGVSQTKYQAVVVVLSVLLLDFHQTEVAHPIMTEAVGLSPNGEHGGIKGLMDRPDELSMWDRLPG